MTLENIDFGTPSHGSEFKYSDGTPPSISMEGSHDNFDSSLTYKWFSSTSRVKVGSVLEPSAYWDSHLNYERDNGSNNNGSQFSSSPMSWTWTSPRIGSQYLSMLMKDVFITETIDNNDQVASELGNITRNGLEGGPTDVTVNSITISKKQIHVVGAIGVVYLSGINRVNNNELFTSNTLNIWIGAECRLGGTFNTGSGDQPLEDGDTLVWGRDNDDEIEYIMEYDDGGTWTEIFDSTVDVVTYRAEADVDDSDYTVGAIGVDFSMPSDPTSFRLRTSRGSTVEIITFDVEVAI